MITQPILSTSSPDLTPKKCKRFQLEELFFLFSTQTATVNDFEAYLTLLYDKSIKFTSYTYIFKINAYFLTNYSKSFHSYAQKILSKSAPHILIKLNSIFLTKYSPSDLLKHLKYSYCINNPSQATLITIQHNINILFDIKQNTDSIPGELLFYLYIISSLQSNNSYHNIGHAKRIIKQLTNDDNVFKITDCSFYENLNQVNEEMVNNILFDVYRSNFSNEIKYIMLIVLFKKIKVPINEKEILSQIQEVFKECDSLLINIFLSVSALQTFLDYFKDIRFNNKGLYFEIFQITNTKIEDKIEKEHKAILLKWIIYKIALHNINLDEYSQLFRFYFINYLHLCVNDDNFISYTLPKMLIQLVNNSFNSDNPYDYYKLFHKILSQINTPEHSHFEFSFSLLYIQLAHTIYKKQILLNNINKITLNTTYPINIDIYFILMYLHSDLRNTMRTKFPFSKLITDMENEDGINFNTFKTSSLHSHSKINSLLDVNAIYYEEQTTIPNFTFNDLKVKINEIAEKEQPYIIFIDLNTNILSQVNNDWCYEYKLIRSKISHSKKDKHKIVSNYNFQGFFIIEKEQNKNVYLYEEVSQCWFNVREKNWSNVIKFNSDQIVSVKMIYYYKRVKKENEVINMEKSKEMKQFPKGKDGDLYWNAFFNLLEINPSLIKRNLDKYIKWMNLKNVANIEKLFNFVERKDLMSLKDVKKILINIVSKRNEISKENEIEPWNELIDKKCIFIKPFEFLCKLKKMLGYKYKEKHCINEDKLNEVVWYVKYYLRNLNKIQNVNNSLVLYITLLCFMSMKSMLSEIKVFWIEKLTSINVISQVNMEILDYVIISLNNCSLDMYFKDISQFWATTEMLIIDDYQMKYLCELIFFAKDIINYKIHKSDSVSDDIKRIQQLNICKKLEKLISNNKPFLYVDNSNNANNMIKFLYLILKHQFQENKILYVELMKICSELINSENNLHYNNIKNIINNEFLSFYTNGPYIIHNSSQEYLLNKLSYLGQFIYEYIQFPFYFSEILLLLKHRTDSFDKLIKPLLFRIYEYSLNKNYTYLQYAIIYYLFYCKVERQKGKIEKIHFKYIHKPHFIFAFRNKHIKSLIKESTTTNNIISRLYNDFKKEASSSHECYFDVNISEYFSKNFISKDIKLMESSLSRKCILIQDDKFKEDTTISMIPNDLMNDNIAPLMIYQYGNDANSILSKIFYLKKKYILKEIIFTYKDKSIILIRNEYNLYWFSLTERIWVDSIKGYIMKRHCQGVIKVYHLWEKKDKEMELNFNNIHINKKNDILVSKHVKDEMKWLLNNAKWLVLQHPKEFKYIFRLNNIPNKEDLLSIDVDLAISKIPTIDISY